MAIIEGEREREEKRWLVERREGVTGWERSRPSLLVSLCAVDPRRSLLEPAPGVVMSHGELDHL